MSLPIRNHLLATLSPGDLRLLQPHFEPVTLGTGDVLIEPNTSIDHVYFPDEGVGSVVALTRDQREIEVGLFGWDGMSGTAVLLGTDRTPHKSFIQIAGRGQRIASGMFREAVGQSASLQALLLRYVQTFIVQTAHTALSNGSYKLEERLARWLLMCHDRVDGEDVPLTHEFLSIMLAVRRQGVTEALNALEEAGIIRARRGLITILNRSKLEAVAGACYGIPEAEYERLIGPVHEMATA